MVSRAASWGMDGLHLITFDLSPRPQPPPVKLNLPSLFLQRVLLVHNYSLATRVTHRKAFLHYSES